MEEEGRKGDMIYSRRVGVCFMGRWYDDGGEDRDGVPESGAVQEGKEKMSNADGQAPLSNITKVSTDTEVLYFLPWYDLQDLGSIN